MCSGKQSSKEIRTAPTAIAMCHMWIDRGCVQLLGKNRGLIFIISGFKMSIPESIRYYHTQQRPGEINNHICILTISLYSLMFSHSRIYCTQSYFTQNTFDTIHLTRSRFHSQCSIIHIHHSSYKLYLFFFYD